MLNDSVINVLKNNLWDVATCADNEPNVVPVGFKDVTAEGNLVVGDVFLDTTLQKITAALLFLLMTAKPSKAIRLRAALFM